MYSKYGIHNHEEGEESGRTKEKVERFGDSRCAFLSTKRFWYIVNSTSSNFFLLRFIVTLLESLFLRTCLSILSLNTSSLYTLRFLYSIRGSAWTFIRMFLNVFLITYRYCSWANNTRVHNNELICVLFLFNQINLGQIHIK